MKTKVTQLTHSNTHALAQAREKGWLIGAPDIRQSTATFDGSPAEALVHVRQAQGYAAQQIGTRGGIYHSLHAVVRKLRDAAANEHSTAPAAGERVKLTSYVEVTG